MTPFQQFQAPAFAPPYNNNAPFQPPFASGPSTGDSGTRTIYIGNVPSHCSIDEVLGLVHGGLVESARLLPEKTCAFVSFVEPSAAAAFHREGTVQKLLLAGNELRVGWGKPSSVPSQVLTAIQQGATRNVFLGGIDSSVTEEGLRADFSQFGAIDTIRILHAKHIAFVHFTSISSAMKAVATLPSDPRYSGRRLNYGKDRCAKQGTGSAPGGMPDAFAVGAPGYPQFGGSMNMPFNPAMDGFSGAGRMRGVGSSSSPSVPGNALTVEGNRTVYLGHLSENTTCEDLCNVIRGGILSNIRFLPQKHIAFVTFVDPQAATNFFNQASQGMVLNGRKLKVSWGQNNHGLSNQVIEAIQRGATRNVYLGSIDESFTVEKLRQDFADFGDTELINILKEKNCGFVNFTNILSAVKAVEGIRRNPDYANVKVSYGRDRCGNPSRPQKPKSSRRSNGSDPKSENGNTTTKTDEEPSTIDKTELAFEDTANDIKAFDEDAILEI
ncbi:MAG: hypothetical protein J3Q66DRAFT_281136 [Benniella sp.]|nr:MAG: hypothetical protein J3Q66DRAFT_281136 [Benniella sp.]